MKYGNSLLRMDSLYAFFKNQDFTRFLSIYGCLSIHRHNVSPRFHNGCLSQPSLLTFCCAGAHYGCEVSCQGVLNLPASYWKADLPVALFTSHCNVCCLQYANFVQQATKMCVCETDIGVLEAHQNDCSYVRQLSGLSFESLRTNLAWWVASR